MGIFQSKVTVAAVCVLGTLGGAHSALAASVSASLVDGFGGIDLDQSDPGLLAQASGTRNQFGALNSGSASADASLGELKIQLSQTNESRFSNRLSGLSRIQETFVISGSGTVSFNMTVEADILADRYLFAGAVQSAGSGPGVRITPTSEQAVSSSSLGTPTDLRFSDTIEVVWSFNSVLPTTVGVTWQMTAWVEEAPFVDKTAMIDAGNTGYISYVASDGITITPSDSRFLAGIQPPDNPVIPLPSSLALLGSAFLIPLARRRRT